MANPFAGILTASKTAPQTGSSPFSGVLTGKATTPVKTPASPAFSGKGYGASTQLDMPNTKSSNDASLGKPLATVPMTIPKTFMSPESTVSTIDTSRIAPNFDPTVAQKLTPEMLQNGRMPQSVSDSVRKQLGAGTSDQLDHAIALELSGSNQSSNLRLEPSINGKTATDPLENALAQKVTKGEISLIDAQRQLAKAKGITLQEDKALNSPLNDYLLNTPNVLKPLAKAQDAIEAVGGFFKGLATGFYNQFVHPSDVELKAEKPFTEGIQNINPLLSKVPYADKVLTLPVKAFVRFFEPMVEPYALDVADTIGGAQIVAMANRGEISQEDAGFIINDLGAVKKSAPHIVGDAMLAVLAVLTPGKVGSILGLGEKTAAETANEIATQAGKGFVQRVAAGAMQGAVGATDVGVGFGIGNVLQSESTNPKDILNIMAQNLAGAWVLGGITGGLGGSVKRPLGFDDAIDQVQKIQEQSKSPQVKSLLNNTLDYLQGMKQKASENGVEVKSPQVKLPDIVNEQAKIETPEAIRYNEEEAGNRTKNVKSNQPRSETPDSASGGRSVSVSRENGANKGKEPDVRERSGGLLRKSVQDEGKPTEREIVKRKSVRTGALKPIKGTGETKVRGLSKGVEAKAIASTPSKLPSYAPEEARKLEQAQVASKLTDMFGELPEYKQMDVADQGARAIDLVEKDKESAKQIAYGAKAPPKGLTPEAVFVAVEQDAIERGDFQTLRELANSRLTAEATTMGQRIRMLAERNPESPTDAIRAVQEARVEAVKKRLGKPVEEAKIEIVKDIKERITNARPKKIAWKDFVQSISC